MGGGDLRKTRIKMFAALAFVVFLALSFTAEPIDTGKKTEVAFYFDNDKFDAKQYVAGIWDERVLPHMTERAVGVRELLQGLESDAPSVCAEHGYRAVGEKNPYNFSVKGRIRVISVSSESSARMEADVEPYDGEPDVSVQVGPVFKGTSIRDFLDFIKFEDFTNQVDFAKLANELNFKVRDDVVKRFDFRNKDYAGAEFDIMGAVTYLSGPPELVVTPVAMTQAGN
jgi:predicted lipoprotein